jgi:hypothetical protein
VTNPSIEILNGNNTPQLSFPSTGWVAMSISLGLRPHYREQNAQGLQSLGKIGQTYFRKEDRNHRQADIF